MQQPAGHLAARIVGSFMWTVVVAIATGCDSGAALSPEATAKRWMLAGLEGDVQMFVDLTCSAQKPRMRLMGEVSVRNDLGDPVANGEALEDLTFETVMNDGSHALVRTGYMDAGLPLVVEQGAWRVCPAQTPT